MRFTPAQLLIKNLKQELSPDKFPREYMTRGDAYAMLKLQTGEDFGDDVAKWENWLRDNPQSIKPVW